LPLFDWFIVTEKHPHYCGVYHCQNIYIATRHHNSDKTISDDIMFWPLITN